MIHIYKHPRLYLNAPFAQNAKISLAAEQAHYLKNVLRKAQGDVVRLFNGQDGEWLACIEEISKKNCNVVLQEKIRQQPDKPVRMALAFSPIKKHRMDILIEKAVELGVTALYPIVMNRTENRKINEERLLAQIVEAAEQSERLDVPVLHSLQKFPEFLSDQSMGKLYVCLERAAGVQPISAYDYGAGALFVIGAEGGFDDVEREMIMATDHIDSIDLGSTILRAETAALVCLSYARFSKL